MNGKKSHTHELKELLLGKKKVTFPKFIYRFNPISLKIENGFYANWQVDSKIYMKM